MTALFIFLYLISTLCTIDTARILAVFPTPSISHQVVFRVLTQELVKRGHEVTVITTDPNFPEGQAPVNLTEIDVHDISYNFLHEKMAEYMEEYKYGQDIDVETFHKQLQTFYHVMEVQIKSELVQKLLQEKRDFDLLLIEAYMRPAIAFTNIFKAPVIQVSSFGATVENLEVIGAPTHPLLYPDPFRSRLYNLSFWDKLREYYTYWRYMRLRHKLNILDDEFLQKIFGNTIPSISDLNKNVDMLFLNVHPIWMDNQPVPPGVIFMGGLHQKPVKELPSDLKSYLDSSQNGVVYVSFGTNVHPILFPPDRLKVITEALSKLPYDILFKWNNDTLPGKSNNIRISKWLPQSDLLRHPKVKAFVMQGGLQSTDEAITAGVPLVCIPMFGDQAYNAEKYVRLQIGLKLDFLTLTAPQLQDAIESVILNKSYRENILKLKEIMNDQPQSALERAIWWIEYVLRHGGGKHLRAPAANMSWAEYYELKLVSTLLITIFTAVIVIWLAIRSLWGHFLQFSPKPVKVKTP